MGAFTNTFGHLGCESLVEPQVVLKTSILGDKIDIFFSVLMNDESIGLNINDLVISQNGIPITITLGMDYYEGIFAFGYFVIPETVTFGKNDVITYSITTTNWKSSGGMSLPISSGSVINGVLRTVSILQESLSGIFGFPHGTSYTIDTMYIGTRTSPATLTSFPNRDDLSIYTNVVVTGRNNIETLIYDQIHEVLYGISSNNDGKLCVLSIPKDHIENYSIVLNTDLIDSGLSPGICTDGNYIYGVTYTENPVIFKINVNDWTFSTVNVTQGALYHSCQINGNYFYATTGPVIPGGVLKVNCETLEYEYVSLPDAKWMTDDFVIFNDNLYLGSELTDKILVVDTVTMTYSSHSGIRSFGLFTDGIDLYSCDCRPYSSITKYPAFDLDYPVSNYSADYANELFFISGRKYFASWNQSSKLVQFELV